MKKIAAIVLILGMMVSLSGCTIFTLMNAEPVEIPTAPVVETNEIETEIATDDQESNDESTRTQFDENGNLMFTEHNYLNIGIYAHDGVTSMELSAVRSILNKIITPEMGDVEKVKAVHDWIVKNTTYEENYYSLDSSRSFIYNLIYNKIAICQGYAVTFYVMMTELGIPCTIISGNAGEPHAWNAVELDGCWYYVDVTWDDPAMSSTHNNTFEDGYNMTYNYLLCSYQYISLTHSEDAYRPNQPSPKGYIDSYNELVHELEGYKGVYHINDEDDVVIIADVIEEPGKYMIYVEDGMDAERQAKQLYLLLKIKSVIDGEKDASVLIYSDAIKMEIY